MQFDVRQHRQRRPPPKEGFTVRELAKLSGVAAITIKSYVRRGLLGRVKFYGAATRYPREHLLRLLAIRLCQFQGLRHLDEIRRTLDASGPGEMERWVLGYPLPPATLTALGHPPKAKQNKETPTATAESTQATQPDTVTAPAPAASVRIEPNSTSLNESFPSEPWRRVVLMAGLELQIKADAGPIVQGVAERLLANFAALLTARS